jgi:hypothetical protein
MSDVLMLNVLELGSGMSFSLDVRDISFCHGECKDVGVILFVLGCVIRSAVLHPEKQLPYL